MSRAMMLLTLVVLLALAAPAFAASDITVTVTLGQLCVDVSPASWALGIVGPTDSKTSWVSGNAGHFTATNCGNVPQDLTIATGSTSPSGWTPRNPVGTNMYALLCGVGVSPYTTEPSWSTVGGEPLALASDIAVGGTVAFDLKFQAPTSDSTYNAGGETFSVSLGVAEHPGYID